MRKLQKEWLQILICMLILLKTESFDVSITYIQSAVAKGAVCLDGSPPAYHFHEGSGEGINNWLVHFEGGAWCNNVTTCLARKTTRLGSSKQMAKQVDFSGMFSNKSKFNPDFYNWNRVKIRYCDGASFTGDIEVVDPLFLKTCFKHIERFNSINQEIGDSQHNKATNLYYRGARIFVAVMEDLLTKGMKKAQNAILSGCSAGGLTSILHCDNFKALFPINVTVKCLADAGFFINTKDVTGNSHIEKFYDEVVTTHGSAKNLPRSCTSKMKPSLCFFPQNMAQGIQTPIFLINSAYDSWQIKNSLAPGVADEHGLWHNCKADIEKCSATQLQTMHEFRVEFLNALNRSESSPSRGYFINSCYAHCQTGMQETWFRSDSPLLNNKTIAKAVGDWFYDKSPFQQFDCKYPCDKTCHNRVFDYLEQPMI